MSDMPDPSRQHQGLARFAPGASLRPASGRLDVSSTLEDFAVVTYAVEPEALARLLPPGFEPELVTLDNGARKALVSAVPFFDRDFRFGLAPWLRFGFGQTNYRAYVWHQGRRAVWFFGTSLATRWVAIPRYLWRLPWHGARMEREVVWDGDRCVRYRLRTRGAWGAAELDLEGTEEPAGRLDGFADAEAAAVVLTHPLEGFYRRRDDRLGTYSVWHAPLRPRLGVVRRARFAVFEELGLIAPGQAPHSVLIQRRTEFVIFLPPRLLDGPGLTPS